MNALHEFELMSLRIHLKGLVSFTLLASLHYHVAELDLCTVLQLQFAVADVLTVHNMELESRAEGSSSKKAGKAVARKPWHLLQRAARQERCIVQVISWEQAQLGWGCHPALHGCADQHHAGQPQERLQTECQLSKVKMRHSVDIQTTFRWRAQECDSNFN